MPARHTRSYDRNHFRAKPQPEPTFPSRLAQFVANDRASHAGRRLIFRVGGGPNRVGSGHNHFGGNDIFDVFNQFLNDDIYNLLDHVRASVVDVHVGRDDVFNVAS